MTMEVGMWKWLAVAAVLMGCKEVPVPAKQDPSLEAHAIGSPTGRIDTICSTCRFKAVAEWEANYAEGDSLRGRGPVSAVITEYPCCPTKPTR